jgi:hypothetical protein
MKKIKIIFLTLILTFTLVSCNYFYGRKKVVKVTNLNNNIITYDFNYGSQVFNFGNDTILYVGDWQDENDVWHHKTDSI